MSERHVYDYIEDLSAALKTQLVSDELRWGDAWLHYTKDGQEIRILDEVDGYYSDYLEKGEPVPWLKIIGNAMIAWIREQHPEMFPKE